MVGSSMSDNPDSEDAMEEPVMVDVTPGTIGDEPSIEERRASMFQDVTSCGNAFFSSLGLLRSAHEAGDKMMELVATMLVDSAFWASIQATTVALNSGLLTPEQDKVGRDCLGPLVQQALSVIRHTPEEMPEMLEKRQLALLDAQIALGIAVEG